MRVLLAEDNPANQEITAGFLKALGYDVTVVDNGAKAVQAWTAAQRNGFDLVLMDCQMPVFDGFVATRTIRALEPVGSRLPILAVTAVHKNGLETSCLEAGMDDLLGKPFRRKQLVDLLNKWKPEYQPQHVAEPTAERDLAVSNLDPKPLEILSSLDPEGSKGILGRAITKFISYGADSMAALAENASQGNVLEVSRLAHSLKSSSANLGAVELAHLCSELETCMATGELPLDIEQRCQALKAAFQAAERELSALISEPKSA